MPFQPKQIVLVDTNVIIEAHRTGCMAQLGDYFKLCTVEKIVAETQAGAQRRRPEQNIDEAWLRSLLFEVAVITDEMRYEFNLRNAHALDGGERDLLIHAESLEQAWLLNSPDMAVVRFANDEGWLDQLVSLESMNRHVKSRLRETLRDNFSEAWLSAQKTAFRLGQL